MTGLMERTGTNASITLLEPHLTPFTLSLQVNAYYFLFAANSCVVLLYLGLLNHYGGSGSFLVQKNLLLLVTVVFVTVYHFVCAKDDGGAVTYISYLHDVILALSEISFMVYQWTRCFPVIETECSTKSVQAFRIILVIASILCASPLVASSFGRNYIPITRMLAGAGTLTLDLFFSVVSYRSLRRRTAAVIVIQGKDAKAAQIITIIARYSGRASAFCIVALLLYVAATWIESRENQGTLTQFLYCFAVIFVNVCLLCGTSALVLMKWKLDAFAHQSDLEEVEDSMPKSRGVADKDVKVSRVPNATRSKPADVCV
ncbi:hypothetical protein HDU80_008372 [Chytriomyces hyalinus]|nr:hypothetical protein HDU80_008372 [Chytriomyces hyalinus]